MAPLRFVTHLAASLAFAGPSFANDTALRIEAAPVSMHVGLHEPIVIDVTLTNPSAARAEIDLGPDFKTQYRLEIVDPQGHETEVPPRWVEGMAQDGRVVIDPGGSFTKPFLLSEWFRFDSLGDYTVRVGIAGAQGQPVLGITVGPRDAERVRRVCDDLETRVRESPLSLGFWPAHVLSFVTDPEAVPYLDGISRSGQELAALDGLGRIGGPDAVRSVEGIIDRAHSESLVVVAGNTLRGIKARTTDEVLKGRIDVILLRQRELDEKYHLRK